MRTKTPRGSGWRRARVAGHFGEIAQGIFRGDVAVLTLPCPLMSVTAHWRPSVPGFTVYQNRPALSPAQIRGVFRRAGHHHPFGQVRLRINVPLGAGSGASTAALLALARVLGVPRWAETETCLALEGASDPLMLDRPGTLLWASRRGRVLKMLPPLPAMHIAGGLFGRFERTDPDDTDFSDIDDLIALWSGSEGDLATLGQVAAVSADRNAERRGADLSALREAALRYGARGYCIAHTGAAQALIFAPGRAPERVEIGGHTARIRYTVGGCG